MFFQSSYVYPYQIPNSIYHPSVCPRRHGLKVPRIGDFMERAMGRWWGSSELTFPDTYIDRCIYLYIYVCIHNMHIYIYMYIICIYIYICVHNMHIYMCVYIICVCIYILLCICICIYLYLDIQNMFCLILCFRIYQNKAMHVGNIKCF
jgi:hypothetical protein